MNKKEYWNYSQEEVMAEFEVSAAKGLTDEQAEQIRNQKGENILQEQKKKSIGQVFLGQFADLLVIILLAAAALSFFSGNAESTVVILVVLLLNAVLGTAQYAKAQSSLESLRQLSSPHAKIMRNGIKTEVASREIVPRDIVLLEAGDMIVADGRILQNVSLQVNESSLTGEAAFVEKTDEVIEGERILAERANMVYAGSLVTSGRAVVLTTATGMDTELGTIAGFLNSAKERKTPLQESLDRFSSRLAVLIILISIVVFALCVYRKMPLLDSIMFAVALAVAAIPEALGSIVTIVQALATQKMAKEHAVIKELKAVESLGCVSVICSDKTGTLTQNKMTVQKLMIQNQLFLPQELTLESQAHRYLLYNAILNNDASLNGEKGIGDPTEYALLEMFRTACKAGICKADPEGTADEQFIRDAMERLEELPFDSDRKLMSTKYCLHGVDTVLTKGAPDVLLERCTHYLDEQGAVTELTAQERAGIMQYNQEFSQQGLRVLAFAYRETQETLTFDTEKDLCFIGLTAMADPPREESAAAVADAIGAGIRPVMITGDHKTTAVAIARQIGIYQEEDLALTGAELDALSEEELEQQITRISVYARVSPQNKIRIVQAWQKKGHIVAMTGDGVNDAPALKSADIGVAMGVTGTEVSKDAAAMILSDDNFATIIKAVANGRNVYRNIKNAVLFLLSGNTAGILTVLYTSAAGLTAPFAPVQLLFMNLLTDSLPALAIGMESADENLLQERPRDPKVGLLTGDFMRKLLAEGALLAAATLAAYWIGLAQGKESAMTHAFLCLTMARLFHGFNCRSDKSIFRLGITTNRYSLLAFAGGMLMLLLVLLIPALHGVFGITALSLGAFGRIAALAFAPTAVIQLYRAARRK